MVLCKIKHRKQKKKVKLDDLLKIFNVKWDEVVAFWACMAGWL
jgi:hypothetical protein